MVNTLLAEQLALFPALSVTKTVVSDTQHDTLAVTVIQLLAGVVSSDEGEKTVVSLDWAFTS